MESSTLKISVFDLQGNILLYSNLYVEQTVFCMCCKRLHPKEQVGLSFKGHINM